MNDVTSLELDDGVTFLPFREGSYWQSMEYGPMYDDVDELYTTRTHVFLNFGDSDIKEHISIDIDLHFEWQPKPVSLLYQPLSGEPFTLAYTAPLSLQIAWKLHQSLEWLRIKDVHDLILLLQHPIYDLPAIEETVAHLVDECYISSGDHQKNETHIKLLLENDFENIRHTQNPPDYSKLWKEWVDYAKVNNIKLMAASFEEMRVQLQDALVKSDFKEYVEVFGLPQPSDEAKYYRKHYW